MSLKVAHTVTLRQRNNRAAFEAERTWTGFMSMRPKNFYEIIAVAAQIAKLLRGPVRDRSGITKANCVRSNANQLQRIETKIRADGWTPANNSILKPGFRQSLKAFDEVIDIWTNRRSYAACIFQSMKWDSEFTKPDADNIVNRGAYLREQ